MFHIGPYSIQSRVLLAPMAGVSDAPFRALCQEMGVGLASSEMLTADTRLWQSRKSSLRLLDCPAAQVKPETAPPRSVQIAGSEPEMMADAARAAVGNGAQIVDINMGCPAKKVCNKAAGSALLRDEALVGSILKAVVSTVDVPVTLKIRTGWSPEARNGRRIARIAEDSGIQALAVHGRTRACRFKGEAEYETIAAIAGEVRIPVIANGDIDSPRKAAEVMRVTGASAVMIGRAAQGQPWLLREIDNYLRTGNLMAPPSMSELEGIIIGHLRALHEFYGDYLGPRIARKHIRSYLDSAARLHQGRADRELDTKEFLQHFNTITSPDLQLACLRALFEELITREDIAA